MGLNSEFTERIATCGARTCANVPRMSWDSVGWETGFSGIHGVPPGKGLLME